MPNQEETTLTPLAGLTVLLAPDARDLAGALTAAGAQTLSLPSFAYAEADDLYPLEQAVENLFGYDWLIFPRTESAAFFLEHFARLGGAIPDLDHLRVCAADHATFLRLAESHVHVDIVTNTPAAFDVAQEMAAYLGGDEALALLNCLIPCGAGSRWPLPPVLGQKGARADAVAVYRNFQGAERTRLEGLLKGGGVDAAIFANETDADHLARLFDTYELNELLAGVTIAAPPPALEALQKRGLASDVVAADLAPALLKHFSALI
jgi:uroporphyrinogen-III synthase